MEPQKTASSQINLEKEKQSRRHHPNLILDYKSVVIKTCGICIKTVTETMEQNPEPRKFDKEGKSTP